MKKKSMKNQTDLSKARQFALPIEDFKKLVAGDIATSISLLTYILRNPKLTDQLIEEMYKDYVTEVENRSLDRKEMEDAINDQKS